jgi:single-strand DNA-binding protein
VANINRVTITGNLTRDPELRSLPSGTAVCELGVAVNHRRKDQTDQWVDEPNYFNVVVFGAQGQNCAQYLSKGRPVAVDGRLRWSSWEDKNGGGKRSKVEIVANVVQFLGSREDAKSADDQALPPPPSNQGFAATSDVPADTSDFGDPVGAPAGGADNDDIPF